MSPSAYVRSKYRKAVCETNGDLCEIVVVTRDGWSHVIGVGHSPREAWQQAAHLVKWAATTPRWIVDAIVFLARKSVKP